MKSKEIYVSNNTDNNVGNNTSKDKIKDDNTLISIIKDETPEIFNDRTINDGLLSLEDDPINGFNDFDIDYSIINETFFAENSYGSNPDLREFYLEDQIYSNNSDSKENKDSALMSNDEAGETVESIIYDSVSGKEGSEELNIEEKRKFSHWLLNRSNRVLLDLYHSTNPMRNDDIEYR